MTGMGAGLSQVGRTCLQRNGHAQAAAKLHGSDDHIKVPAIPHSDAGFPYRGSVAQRALCARAFRQ
jgi:hypothetical protein